MIYERNVSQPKRGLQPADSCMFPMNFLLLWAGKFPFAPSYGTCSATEVRGKMPCPAIRLNTALRQAWTACDLQKTYSLPDNFVTSKMLYVQQQNKNLQYHTLGAFFSELTLIGCVAPLEDFKLYCGAGVCIFFLKSTQTT